MELIITYPKLFFITLTLVVLFFFRKNNKRRVFLVDFSCYKPPKNQQVDRQTFVDKSSKALCYNKDSLEFMDKMLERSGLGDKTYLSKGLLKEPTDMSAEAAKEEVEMAIFGVIDELLLKTGVQCEDIGMLITVFGGYNIMPSVSSVIVKRYNLRHDIRTYNVTGMGCTAGLVALGLVQNLLKVIYYKHSIIVLSVVIIELYCCAGA